MRDTLANSLLRALPPGLYPSATPDTPVEDRPVTAEDYRAACVLNPIIAIVTATIQDGGRCLLAINSNEAGEITVSLRCLPPAAVKEIA